MAIGYDYLGRSVPISKPVDGWQPPDTDGLKEICNLLAKISNRIHSLRVAVSINYGIEIGRLHRVIASRKRAIEKAYQKGLNAGRKKRRHA